MPALRWYMASAVLLSLSACKHSVATTPTPAPAVFAVAAPGRDRTFEENFSGRWEIVRGRHDGRFRGTSARSFHTGDSLSFIFAGNRFRLYGVTGPKGGDGVLSIVGAPTTLISFYTPKKRTHVLLYTSPLLSDGAHAAAIVVSGSHEARSHGNYVNIDGLEIENPRKVRMPAR